jgi:hypothetical protein
LDIAPTLGLHWERTKRMGEEKMEVKICPYLEDCEHKNFLCNYGIYPYKKCEFYHLKITEELIDSDLDELCLDDSEVIK